MFKHYTAVLCVALVSIPPYVTAQTATTPVAATESGDWHSRFTRRYLNREIAPINLTNSTRLDSLIRAGKIYLSLQDAVALALENNLDIELQRYGPRLAEADLLRSQAGGVVRGVPTSVSQGPQSADNLQTGAGGSGGLGSSATNSGGSLGGATVVFSGTQTPTFDESLFVNYSWGHRTIAQANSFSTGIPALVFKNNQLTSGIQKGFITGATMQLGYTQQIQNSNNLRAEINPVNSGNVGLNFTQPLLRGFGIAINNRFIRIARNEVKISDLVFKQQVIATVANVINLYSDLVSFNEDVKVRRQSLALNEKLYNDVKKQVEIGTLAPIEIVRSEAEVARAQQDLTTSETQLLQQETIIKNYLSRTGVSNPPMSDARIMPTDTLRIPDTEEVRPIQDLVGLAIENRPELVQTRLAVENSRISLQGSKSALLPQLDLVAAAQNNGLAGLQNTLPLPPDVSTGLIPIRSANGAFLGGLGSVWSQIFSRNYPDYSIGFQLNIPLRNRTAQADIMRDQLTLRQQELRQRQELNQIRVDVQTGLIGLQQSRARYQAAQKSRVLQEQTLDAEQKKYALGASTIFFVIQAQRDLAQAQAAEVAALSAYNRSRVQLDRATGQILTVHNVSVEEAMAGKVANPPSPIPVQIQ